MLDKRCVCLLEVLNGECESSGYKIFSIEELVLAMPESLGVDAFIVEECIKTLCDHEYISVKYQDDVEVCLCPLTKGRLVFENKIDQELEKSKDRKLYLWFSFFGAFLGGFFVTLITITLLMFSGVA